MKKNTWLLLAAAGGIGLLIYRKSAAQKAALPAATGNYFTCKGCR